MAEIFYFSPTGTGRTIAEKLCREFPIAKCFSLTQLKTRAFPAVIKANSLLTLIFPVYAHGVPAPLREWISALPERSGPVCLICTYGSISPGCAIAEAAELFRKSGGYVAAAAEVPGPHSYDCAQTRFDLKRAGEPDLKSVVRFFQSVLQKVETGCGPVVLEERKSISAFVPQELLARLATHYPTPNRSKCLDCNQCNVVCPVDATENPAACIRCAACVRTCPASARELRFRMPVPPIYLRGFMKRRPPRFIL